MPYLLSIVVPTKDRYFYLKHLIRLVDSFNSEEVELVIQDNTDDNQDILSFLMEKERPNLKYNHNAGQLPVSRNTDLAIGQATGEYICFIGDDDGVLPNIIDCVKWMKRHDIDALRPAITVYNWPDFIDFTRENLAGVLYFNRFTGHYREIDPMRSLQKMAKKGFPHIYTLPKVYQGIVKRRCLDEIYRIGGTYSPGPSPDMATAVALAYVVRRFVILDIPVILIGQCRTVGGGERELGGGVENIENVPFLPKDASDHWDPGIPRVWCSHTVWPESAVKAMQYMDQNRTVKVNYGMILARFIRAHPLEKGLTRELKSNSLKIRYALLSLKTDQIRKALAWRIKFVFTGRKTVDGREITVRGLQTILDASDYLTDKYSETLRRIFND